MQVICLERVSLSRRTQEEFSYDLKRTILSLLEGKRRKHSHHLVLDRVDLRIDAGKKVGIIGANGAGKSTLLKLICGILKPTSGQVWVTGRIAPLIELEAGFEPELSVVDNIILYGVLLGFSRKEMVRRTASILQFSGLEDYALVPVKSLSSGMAARLGFAIATDVQPDILILDEVLSVGDESFKARCRKRIERFWSSNTTVLLVSHDLQFVSQECDQAIWLDQGRLLMQGDAREVVHQYLNSVRQELGISPLEWELTVQEALC